MSNKLSNILIVIFTVIFLASTSAIVIYRINLSQDKNNFEEISRHRQEVIEQAEADRGKSPRELTQKEKMDLYGITTLSEENEDLYAWINFSDAGIDYPVMYTPKVPTYYLRKDFYKKYSLSGTPFFDGRTDILKETEGSSPVCILYGHNMGDGTMFTNLKKYTSSESLKNAGTVVIDTKEGRREYKVFATVKVKEYTQMADRFYSTTMLKDSRSFDSYINFLKEISVAKSGEYPQFGDELLMLSTCSKHTKGGRLAVMAYRTEI